MKTDKQYYKIFEVKPDWVYLLSGAKPPGRVQFRSVAIKEIEAMMLSELPSLEETVAGKELIQLGEARGEARGLAEAVVLLMAERFERISGALRKQILALPKATAQALLKAADDITSLESLKQWLARHPARKFSSGESPRGRR